MEDVLDLYAEEPDRKRPVVCFDESPTQLIGEVRQPIKAKPGQYAIHNRCNERPSVRGPEAGAPPVPARRGPVVGSILLRKRDGFYVDVGAYDGIVISNSYYFEQIGWAGVLVEPNPTKAALCRKNRPHSRVFECAAVSSRATTEVELHDVPGGEVYSSMVALKTYGLSSRRISVPARTLDTILEEVNPPHFVSIDVEGSEIEELADLQQRARRAHTLRGLSVADCGVSSTPSYGFGRCDSPG